MKNKKVKKQKIKKAFVTGVGGFIGSHLADHLLENGWQVFGVDNFLTGSRKNIDPRVKYETVDIRKKDKLESYMKKIKPDYVFHLAAIARTPWTIDDPMLCHETNITGTLNILLIARDLKVKKVVYASSNIVYAAETPYKVSKLAGEGYMRSFNDLFDLPTISLRFSNAYGSLRQSEQGPSINCIASLRKSMNDNGYIWITGDGNQSRDFTHVLDLAEGLRLASESKVRGISIDLCTGINISMNKIASYFKCKVKHVADRPGDIKHIRQNPLPAKKLLNFVAKRRVEDNIQVYL